MLQETKDAIEGRIGEHQNIVGGEEGFEDVFDRSQMTDALVTGACQKVIEIANPPGNRSAPDEVHRLRNRNEHSRILLGHLHSSSILSHSFHVLSFMTYLLLYEHQPGR